ncbi:MAG: hypothetical protein WC761_00230 [Candidatus Paceibacterota bacterium]|jgi:hypothetical protein
MTNSNNKNNFIELLLAKRLMDKKGIHEASLGRIMQHAAESPKTGFAMLTSWRQNLDRTENLRRFSALKSALRSKGLGFNVLNGHWRECQDPSVAYENCPEDQFVDAIEPSVFVSKISLKDAHELGNAYQQDAVVYAGPETKGLVSLIFKDGTTMELGKFSPMAISQAYSELRSGGKNSKKSARYFHFEYIEWPTQGSIESLMEQAFRTKMLALTSE